jgi:hypothetical protein
VKRDGGGQVLNECEDPPVTLAEVVARLREFDDELTIYAKKPWEPGTPAVVAEEPEDGSLPRAARGFSYFLEVHLAREVADAPHPAPLVDRLIYYAENDAYLDPN